MSRFTVFNAIIDDRLRTMSDGQFRVFCVLWRCADTAGENVLSIERIAFLTGLSKKTVRNLLSELYAAGLAESTDSKSGRGHSLIRRRICVPKMSATDAETVPPSGTDNRETVPENGRKCPGKRMETVPENGSAIRIIQNRDSEQRFRSAKRHPGFDQFWAAWPTHFRKRDPDSCRKLWISRGLESRAAEIIARVEGWKLSDQWTKDDAKFLPGPRPWLNQRTYDAPAPPAAAERPVDEDSYFGDAVDPTPAQIALIPGGSR